jgi:hypothetical protein
LPEEGPGQQLIGADQPTFGTVRGGSNGGNALALALVLSVIAATGTGIVLTALIVYGMARVRTLPPSQANIGSRPRSRGI